MTGHMTCRELVEMLHSLKYSGVTRIQRSHLSAFSIHAGVTCGEYSAP